MSLKRLHPKYENITSKWGNMSLRIEMGKRIDNWLSVFPNDNKGILLKLLSSFYYYDEAHVKGKAKSLYEAFINRFEGDPSEIIYTKIHNDHTAAHSDVFFTQFWMTNEIYNNSVVDIIPLIEEQVPRTLAIVDDFSGSGLSLMSTINRILEANSGAKEIEYCFLVLHITEYAEESIRDYGKAVGIDIKIFPLECSKKAFTKDYIFSADTVEAKKREYSDIYDKYLPIGGLKYGFDNVSSLVAFFYNTPNNTLGLFWQEIDKNKVLFKRDTRYRNTQLRQLIESTRRRKAMRDTVIYGADEKRQLAMLEYCIESGKDFSILNFENKFDLVPDQADDILKRFLQEGQLIKNENEFVPSEKLKSNMFITRLKKRRKTERGKRSRKSFDTHEEYIPVNFGKEK